MSFHRVIHKVFYIDIIGLPQSNTFAFDQATLDELVKDIDVQEVREKNLNSERLNSIYSDVENAKKIIKWGAIIGGCIAAVLLIVVIVLIFSFVY